MLSWFQLENPLSHLEFWRIDGLFRKPLPASRWPDRRDPLAPPATSIEGIRHGRHDLHDELGQPSDPAAGRVAGDARGMLLADLRQDPDDASRQATSDPCAAARGPGHGLHVPRPHRAAQVARCSRHGIGLGQPGDRRCGRAFVPDLLSPPRRLCRSLHDPGQGAHRDVRCRHALTSSARMNEKARFGGLFLISNFMV